MDPGRTVTLPFALDLTRPLALTGCIERLETYTWYPMQGRVQEFLKGGGRSGSQKRQFRRDFQTDKQKKPGGLHPLPPGSATAMPLYCAVLNNVKVSAYTDDPKI